jgi:Domain of unknown function (DUF4118)
VPGATVNHDAQESVAGWTIAIVGPIAVAALLVPFRDELVSTNLALILVVVVVLAAIAGGRGPGVVAAVVAMLSFDFFLTRPYLTMNIESTDDLETAIILLVIGLIVGQLVTVARRSRGAAARGADEVARLHRVAELAAQGASLDELTASVESELMALLELETCRFERPVGDHALPRLERGGAVVGGGARKLVGQDFALPESGVELPVLGRGKLFGRVVMIPKREQGVSVEERIVAVALADQLGAALAASEGQGSETPN